MLNVSLLMCRYVRFINSRRAEVKQQHPHLQFSEITKILGLEWSNLLQEEKQVHVREIIEQNVLLYIIVAAVH